MYNGGCNIDRNDRNSRAQPYQSGPRTGRAQGTRPQGIAGTKVSLSTAFRFGLKSRQWRSTARCGRIVGIPRGAVIATAVIACNGDDSHARSVVITYDPSKPKNSASTREHGVAPAVWGRTHPGRSEEERQGLKERSRKKCVCLVQRRPTRSRGQLARTVRVTRGDHRRMVARWFVANLGGGTNRKQAYARRYPQSQCLARSSMLDWQIHGRNTEARHIDRRERHATRQFRRPPPVWSSACASCG